MTGILCAEINKPPTALKDERSLDGRIEPFYRQSRNFATGCNTEFFQGNPTDTVREVAELV